MLEKSNFKKLSSIFNNNKLVLQNFSYLSILQLFNLLSPLIVYPYLIKVVGLELYGTVVFAQAIVVYLSIIINFGFGISGPKEVAIIKEDKFLLSQYFCSVMLIKFILWIFCFFLFFLIIFSIDYFINYRIVYVFAFFFTLGDLLFPIWFFQGIEKMKYITYINIFVKLLFVISIFVLIKDSSHFIYIPLLYSLGAIISGLIGLFIAFKKEGIFIAKLSKKILIDRFNEGFTLFISSVSVKIYLTLNKIIVGSFLGMKEIAIYDFAEKIISLLKTPIIVFSQAIFPKVSISKSITYINQSMLVLLTVIIFGYLIIFFSVDLLSIYFLGDINIIAQNILKILGLTAVFMSLNICYSLLRLIPFGYEKEYSKIIISNTIVFLTFIFVLWFSNSITLINIAIVSVLIEIYCLLFSLYYSKRFNLLT